MILLERNEDPTIFADGQPLGILMKRTQLGSFCGAEPEPRRLRDADDLTVNAFESTLNNGAAI